MAKKKPVIDKEYKASTKETKKKDPSEDILDKVNKDFKASWDYTAGSWHERWNNNYKLYHNQRVKRGYFGISDTFVPMTFSTIETMTSALFGSKPRFNYLPPREKSDQKTDILNSLVDFYWEKDQWSIKTINTGRGMLMRGTGIDYFYWNGDHPCLINVPLRDFFIDPTATSIENARYMGRRYLISKAELEEYEIVDLDGKTDEDGNYPFKKKYTNLDKLDEPHGATTTKQTAGSNASSGGNETTDKQEKDIFYGSTLTGDDADQIEVIEYWTKDNVYSMANRHVIIESDENYYKAKDRQNGAKYPEGLMPFAGCRDYVDESLFYAKGEIDFISDQQEDLNDGTNQRKDALTYTINQMYTIDTTKTSVLPQEVENLPGAVYPGEMNAIVPIQRGTIPPDSFNETQNIKNEMRETTASNEIVKGAQQSGSATATEINAQIAGAGQRINLKVTQIENEYFHRMARIVLQMVRLYVTEKMMVRIVGKDGAKWEEFDPSDFDEGDYEPRVQLQISIESQKSQFSANAKEMYAALLNDPDIDQVELKKLFLSKGMQLDPDEVELLMVKAEDMAPPPMPEMPPMPESMPPVDPMMAGMPPMDAGMMMPPPMPEEDIALMAQQGGGEMYVDPITGEQIPIEMLM